jgi:hypothetical protein
MFHLSVDAKLLEIAIQSNEVKSFIHSRYEKWFYSWESKNAQGDVGGVRIFYFVVWIRDLSHGWTNAIVPDFAKSPW